MARSKSASAPLKSRCNRFSSPRLLHARLGRIGIQFNRAVEIRQRTFCCVTHGAASRRRDCCGSCSNWELGFQFERLVQIRHARPGKIPRCLLQLLQFGLPCCCKPRPILGSNSMALDSNPRARRPNRHCSFSTSRDCCARRRISGSIQSCDCNPPVLRRSHLCLSLFDRVRGRKFHVIGALSSIALV